MAEKKKKKFSLTPFSIILLLLVVVAIITMFCNGQETGNFSDITKDLLVKEGLPAIAVPESEDALKAFLDLGYQKVSVVIDSEPILVSGAGLSNILMSVSNGFANAMEVIIFVFILGGFLGLVAHSGALETGIAVLVKKLQGKELVIIPVLMTVFSICGSTYGMLEESVGFYALLSGTMVAAGLDTIVASSIVLLGAGSGVLGSTVNPFAVGAAQGACNDALAALGKDYKVNMGSMIAIGACLWILALGISIFFVMTYAMKIKKDKGSTFLSLQEQEAMNAEYGNKGNIDAKLDGRQKAILILFAITFLVMILMFIPWFDLIPALEYDWDNMAVVKGGAVGWTEFIFGVPFGVTYMLEAATWFLFMGIVIGIVDMAGREEQAEHKIVDTFIAGCTDMMSVCLVIAVSRGVSVLMNETNFSPFLVNKVGGALENLHPAIFTPLNYLFHVVLSVLVPSSSGIAALSGGVMGPIAFGAGKNVEVTLMTMVAANGVVNLITPTCGAIMGGLALARVDYSTWVKFAAKIVGTIALASMVLLTIWGLF